MSGLLEEQTGLPIVTYAYCEFVMELTIRENRDQIIVVALLFIYPRFYQLVKANFFKDARVFRVVPVSGEEQGKEERECLWLKEKK